jgi:hypothetical protein
MRTALITLIVIAVVLALLGILIKTLLWLAFIGLALFVGTAVYWWVRGRTGSASTEVE